MRHRNDLVMMASEHIQHMQKALTQMNVQFQHVINDITGLTALAILDAILAASNYNLYFLCLALMTRIRYSRFSRNHFFESSSTFLMCSGFCLNRLMRSFATAAVQVIV